MGDTALLQLFPVTGLQLCAALIAEQCIVRDGRAALRAALVLCRRSLGGRSFRLCRGLLLVHHIVHLCGLCRGQRLSLIHI